MLPNKPWGEAICFICSKCGEKISPGGELAENLKKESKKLMRSQHPDRQIRITTSGCLGLCPDKQITLGVFSSTPSEHLPTVETLSPDTTSEQLVARLLNLLSL